MRVLRGPRPSSSLAESGCESRSPKPRSARECPVTDSGVGAVGPMIFDDEGRLDFSQRRFPRVVSTFAQALFLQRAFPAKPWVDEMIRDERLYLMSRDAEWLSGACLMLRRSLVESLSGLDESFFMYCEDTDICRRSGTAATAFVSSRPRSRFTRAARPLRARLCCPSSPQVGSGTHASTIRGRGHSCSESVSRSAR